MQVDFYHLTATPLDRALPQIAAKVVEGGQRLLIVSARAEQRAGIDRLLWSYRADSFVPHAQIGAGDDTRQPILIADDVVAANAARHVALVDGEWREAALDFDRAFHFFEDEHIRSAREAWRALGGRDGIERRYWKQNDAGRWEQAA
ncbi:DNA polymerase III subunit chi [Sphingomonas sp. RIT328]|uniref:DNA polymerase III subunit chi n=1 Tax=Sphingomonas sp. RIT328 TaxID=1470591 RepID=UPI000445580C|nr:DNA polymerase III subunit chi [Sphingomonas sp. RIT328]EZP49090.1 DNA polymerase III chi subunit, HolC family protein [Sphingomonas sp. RIT328]